ncbi:MAG: hypothetical protein PHN80_13970 [Hespellia sp.]|nr:hypothetical protein [Hespellia sp.]
MLKRMKTKYYLRKLKRKKIDLQSVAIKLSMPKEKVKEEYNRYTNPFKPVKIELFFSIFALVISMLTTFVALETLNEMKREREIAYKPDLRVYENDISLYWSESGKQIRREDSYTRQYQTDEKNILYAVYLNIDNIGNGNAKDIKYDWRYEENIEEFNSFLEDTDVKASLVESDNLINIEHKGGWISSYLRSDENDMESYISQDMQKRVMIPSAYLELLTSYCYEKISPSSEIEYNEPLTVQDFPTIQLYVSYKDIQGKTMRKKVKIGFESIVYEKDTNGKGNCSLRVRNLSEEELPT